MDRAKILEQYLAKLDDKHFSIFDVRQELEKNKVEEEEIKVIMRLVDNELQRRTFSKSQGEKSKEIMWFGGVIFCLGLAITIGTFTGFIDMGNYFLVAYGPVLGGLSILMYGVGKRR